MRKVLVRIVVLIACLALVACAGPGPAETPAAEMPAAETPTAKATAESVEPTQEEDASPWRIIHQTGLPSGNDTNSAAFFGEALGVAVGGYPEGSGGICYTADGGETWSEVYKGGRILISADVVDENMLWVVGDSELNLSTDGGQSWQQASRIPCRSVLFDFVDGQVGWVVCGAMMELLSTQDGGQNWVEIAKPEGIGTITAVSLRTADDGYLLDNTGTLYITQDGGQSWSTQTLGVDKEILTSRLMRMAIVHFSDADHGLVLASLAGEKGEILALRTANGGQSWERESVPVSIGPLHLTPDGMVLTVTKLVQPAQIIVLRYQGS